MIGYNPLKLGRPSHLLHVSEMGGLRPVLDTEAGNRSHAMHKIPKSQPLLARMPADEWPTLGQGTPGTEHQVLVGGSPQSQREHPLFRVVGATYQRPGLDMPEAKLTAMLANPLKLLRGVILLNR